MKRMWLLAVFVASPLYANPEITVDLPGGATMDFLWVEPGTFLMGTTEEQEQLLRGKGMWDSRSEDEQPQHEVTISQGFWLGKYEITQAQWEAVMESPPGLGNGPPREIPMGLCPSCSATSITWGDAQGFIHTLNEAAGDSLYRLPTEAEWEYAARAGTTTLWGFGDDEGQLVEYAWWYDNRPGTSAGEVGLKLPNPWGFYDMHGNAMEWVQDSYGPYSADSQTDPLQSIPLTEWRSSWRTMRAGSVQHWPSWTRSGFRFGMAWWTHSDWLGARLLRMDPPPTAVSPESWGQLKSRQQAE